MKSNLAVYLYVEEAMGDHAHGTVYVAVYGAVYWAVGRAVERAVCRAARRGLRHPAIPDFLARAGAEAP
jgi:hypothetical protein